jgi:hypothetical protein
MSNGCSVWDACVIPRTQMGKHSKSVMVVVYGMPCVIPPHKH